MFRGTVASLKERSFLHVIKLVSPFVAVVLLQALMAIGSLDVLSSVRAYVAGEALWSRAQKNAVYYLDLYLHSGDRTLFGQYQEALAVPLGDKYARLALEREPEDLDAATRGFLQGGNHPDDVPGLIWLYRYFHDVSFMKTAIRHWVATDPMLLELTIFGEAIDAEMKQAPIRDERRLRFLTNRLYELNHQFTERANQFSIALGEGSRTIKMLLTLANLATAGTLILLMVWRIRRLVLQREAFENALKAEKERLHWQATHDPMTGLANRRDFEVRLAHELGEVRRAPLALILLDLDQFKAVNDSCGHLAGDRLLCDVASLLQKDRRPNDHIARLGGDEFGIILPHCAPYDAVDVAERLRRSFELFAFSCDDRSFEVTASIGLACISDAGMSLEEALRQADAACYGAKQKGRNRVQVYQVRPEVIPAGSAKRQTAGV